MRIVCFHCAQRYDVPDTMAGRRVRCKKCGATLSIPSGDSVEDIRPSPRAQQAFPKSLLDEELPLQSECPPPATDPFSFPAPQKFEPRRSGRPGLLKTILTRFNKSPAAVLWILSGLALPSMLFLWLVGLHSLNMILGSVCQLFAMAMAVAILVWRWCGPRLRWTIGDWLMSIMPIFGFFYWLEMLAKASPEARRREWQAVKASFAIGLLFLAGGVAAFISWTSRTLDLARQLHGGQPVAVQQQAWGGRPSPVVNRLPVSTPAPSQTPTANQPEMPGRPAQWPFSPNGLDHVVRFQILAFRGSGDRLTVARQAVAGIPWVVGDAVAIEPNGNVLALGVVGPQINTGIIKQALANVGFEIGSTSMCRP